MPTYHKTALTNYGGWIPSNPKVLKSLLSGQDQRARKRSRAIPVHVPAVAEFETAIKTDPEMVDLFEQSFLQASPENTIHSFESLLYVLDDILSGPPFFYQDPNDLGGTPVGVPIYLRLDLISNTAAAHDLFRKPAFNDAMKNLLESWGKYLKTDDSSKTLTEATDGWFSQAAMNIFEDEGRGNFEDTYICPDPQAVNRGYRSWDEFFTREVQPGARPIQPAPGDIEPTLIRSACESTVYRIEDNIKSRDQFWLKGQNYSLCDMLGSEQEAKKFVGGTVYQAFLGPQDYHRWRAPISGNIVRVSIIPGSYYAALPDEGAEVDGLELMSGDARGAIIRSQAWLTQASARAIIYIDSEDPLMGVVCFIGVGMCEVSSCDITVPLGKQVKVGDELGMFHFGGSSHTLIFGPQAAVTFAEEIQVNKHIKVNTIIGQISPPK